MAAVFCEVKRVERRRRPAKHPALKSRRPRASSPSPAGGMAEKRGARQRRGRGGTEGRPQPHHLRGPAVGLGELHLRRQQHRGQETQRHRRRGGLR